ncbi:MAG: hypothetical protein HMLKMBBP_01836 [Planctomycetes bacterium]|nr:hypothetical protein [Planctomycetota bacterium]
MSALRHLVRHELRCMRVPVAVTGASVAAAAAGVVLWDRSGRPGSMASDSSMLVTGAAFFGAWLTGAAAAADAFAQDVATRRIDRHALLPLPLRTVHTAKCAAVGVAALAGWAAATIAASAAAFGVLSLVGAAATIDRAALALAAAVPVVAMTILLAIVLEHALGAVLSGVVLCAAALVATATSIPLAEWGVGPWDGAACGLLLACALLAAARAAFVRGPVHLDRRWRRAAIALGGLVLLAAPAGIAAAAVLDWRADVAPGDRSAVPAAVRLSPDGRRAVVLLGCTHAPQTCRAWLMDLDGGNAVPVPGRFRAFDRWDVEGLRLLSIPRNAADGLRTDIIDPATGRIVRSRAYDSPTEPAAPTGSALVATGPEGVTATLDARGRILLLR